MRSSSLAMILALVACGALSIGCRRSAPPRDAAQTLLHSPDPDARKDAAHDLADDEGPTPDLVPALITALEREQDPDVYSAILIALGKSGAPEAKPYLEVNINNKNKGVRRNAEKALALWSRRNPNGVPPASVPVMPPSDGAMPPPPPGAPPLPPPPPPPPPPPADSGQQI